MAERIELVFADTKLMLGRLGKAAYEKNMTRFRQDKGYIFREMIEEIEKTDDKTAAAAEAGKKFADDVFETFAKGGRIGSRKQADVDVFMIYYVFPAILLTSEDHGKTICDSLRDTWNAKFPGKNLDYADYNTLYNSFREKLFGFF